MADPPRSFVDDLPERIFEPLFPSDVPDDREILAVRRPVRREHALLDFPGRRAARDADPRQRTHPREGAGHLIVKGECHFSGGGDGEQVGPRDSERTGLRALVTAREDLDGFPFPARRVEDRLPVRCEPRRVNLAPPERHLRKGRRRNEARFLPDEIGARERRGDAGGRDRQGKNPLRADRRNSGYRRGAGRGDSGQRLEVEREIAGRLEPLLRVLLQAVAQDSLQPRRDTLVRDREIRRILSQDRRHRVRRRIPLEGAAARQHLVKNRAESEDVASSVRGLPAHLFGRHVAHRPHNDAGLGAGGVRRQVGARFGPLSGVRQLGETEVENLHPAVPRHEDVLGLEIPVDDALLVRGGQTLRELDRVVDRLARGEPPPRERRAQRLSLEKLGDHVRRAVVRADVEDRRDVRVVQESRRPRLLLEPPQAVRIRREGHRQHLDRDVAPQARILRAVDLPHPAGADRREDLVRPESGAGGETHFASDTRKRWESIRRNV